MVKPMEEATAWLIVLRSRIYLYSDGSCLTQFITSESSLEISFSIAGSILLAVSHQAINLSNAFHLCPYSCCYLGHGGIG